MSLLNHLLTRNKKIKKRGKENDDFKRIQRKSMGYFEKKILKGFFGLSYCRLNFFCRNIYA